MFRSRTVLLIDGGLLPALHVKRRKGFECSLTGEELEATLCVLDPSHTKEPHKEVKAIHQKCTEHRSLWKQISLVIDHITCTFSTMTLSQTDKYLSYRGFLQVSSGATGNRHVALNIQSHFWSNSPNNVSNQV